MDYGFSAVTGAFGVWLTRGQELVVATEPELFPEELDVLDPVDPEPAHVVTQPIPDEHLPNGDVVVEVLQLELPLGDVGVLVLVPDGGNGPVLGGAGRGPRADDPELPMRVLD